MKQVSKMIAAVTVAMVLGSSAAQAFTFSGVFQSPIGGVAAELCVPMPLVNSCK